MKSRDRLLHLTFSQSEAAGQTAQCEAATDGVDERSGGGLAGEQEGAEEDSGDLHRPGQLRMSPCHIELLTVTFMVEDWCFDWS